jgi:hypothetical protein
MVLFSNQKSKFGLILEGLAMEDVYGHLIYFVVIWGYFSRFGMLYQ